MVRYLLRKLIFVFVNRHLAPGKRQRQKKDKLLEKTRNNFNKEDATIVTEVLESIAQSEQVNSQKLKIFCPQGRIRSEKKKKENI